ncbi:MAG: acyl-CoA dehydrogenase family protein [Bacteriovoracales bacterium]|nr:acyl-CoA dehydrogenase family protein [Bacteriovoracales bacterium]
MESQHEEIRNLSARFADDVVAPLAHEIDRRGEIPDSIIKSVAESGFFGIFIPEEYGGAAMDYTSYAIIMEEISRACASTSVVITGHNSLCVWPIMHFGTPEQKKTHLPPMASGEKLGCFCLSEPGAGSDAGSLTTFAKEEGDFFEISGTKNFITNGKEAKLAIVMAKTQKSPDYRSITAFIVDMTSKGITVNKLEDKLGLKGSSTAQIHFDKVRVPKENLLGERERGFRVAMATLDGGRIGVAAQALGIAEAAFRYAKGYSKQRVQFGAPISNLQAVQFMLADMSTKIAASRLLILEASRLKDRGEKYTKEAAQAKLFASEASAFVTHKAIQVLGGCGYIKEYPVERHFRDARITEIYEGTSEIQRLVIAAQELKG